MVKASSLKFYAGRLLASIFLIEMRKVCSIAFVQTTRLNRAKLNIVIEFLPSHIRAHAARALEAFSTNRYLNPSSDKLATRGDTRRRRSWNPEIQRAHHAHTRKARALALMRTRSPDARGSSRGARGKEGDKTWRRIPHLLGRRQVAARPHAPPHAQ